MNCVSKQAWTDDWSLRGETVTQDCQFWPVSLCSSDLLVLAEFSTDQHTALNRPKNSLQVFYVQLQDPKNCLGSTVE